VDPEARLAEHRRTQGGVFNRQQALLAGYRPAEVDTALRRGQWRTVRYGVHALAEDLADPGSVRQTALLVAAARLRGGSALVAYGRTACVLHQLPLLAPAPPVPELVLPRTPGTAARRDVPCVWLPQEHVVQRFRLPVTSPSRTVVDVARTSSFWTGVVAADGALQAGITASQLAAVLESCRRSRGSRRATAVLAAARPGAESALESIGRLQLVAQGLPEPELQVELGDADGFIGRVDHYWRERRVIGEADGRGKYAGAGALWAEKVREDRLRDAGFEVVRYGWQEARDRPERLAARVRAAFARAARRSA